jgi:hypothetical protein
MSVDEVEKRAQELAKMIADVKAAKDVQGSQLGQLDVAVKAMGDQLVELRQAQEAVKRAALESRTGETGEERAYLIEQRSVDTTQRSAHSGERSQLATDKGAIQLLGAFQKSADGTPVWRWGYMDDPEPRTEHQRRVQRKLTERAIVRAAMAPDRRRTPRLDAELMDELRGGPAAVSKIFSDSSGIGAEWIPDRAFPELERDIMVMTNFSSIFESRDVGPGGTVKLPYKSGYTRVYKHGVPSTDNPADDILSSWTTADRTIDTVPSVAAFQVDRDASEDSIIAIVPEIRQDMSDAFAYADDDTWVNGDIAATHQDAIATWDGRGRLGGTTGLGTTADHRRRWLGLRAMAADLQALHSAGATDQNATQTADGLRAALLKLKMDHLIESDGKVSVVIAPSPEYFFGKMIDWDEFDAFDNVGALASVLSGQLGDVGRTPGGLLPHQVGFLWGRFPVCLAYPLSGDLAATGLYTGSSSTTGMLQFNRSRFQNWIRKGMMVESQTEIKNNTVTFVARKRSVGRSKDTVVAATKSVHYSYNLTY